MYGPPEIGWAGAIVGVDMMSTLLCDPWSQLSPPLHPPPIPAARRPAPVRRRAAGIGYGDGIGAGARPDRRQRGCGDSAGLESAAAPARRAVTIKVIQAARRLAYYFLLNTACWRWPDASR